MSNAGAQHKLAVCIRDGELFEPVGSTPSTHLLKPNHVDAESWPHSVANEFFVMRLAARLGLSVPPVQMRYVPDPIYLIERFDRQQEGGETRRLHIIDACQALGLDRTFKYQQATVANLIRCVDICANRARSRQSILEWVLFNVLAGNGDTHFKNLSFRVHPGGIDLAPFYDLVSTESYHAEPGNDPRWPNVDFSIQIGEAKKFAAITRNHFLAFADELGVNPRAASRVLDEFRAAIGPAANELVAEFETSDIPQAARAGQLRARSHLPLAGRERSHAFGLVAASRLRGSWAARREGAGRCISSLVRGNALLGFYGEDEVRSSSGSRWKASNVAPTSHPAAYVRSEA